MITVTSKQRRIPMTRMELSAACHLQKSLILELEKRVEALECRLLPKPVAPNPNQLELCYKGQPVEGPLDGSGRSWTQEEKTAMNRSSVCQCKEPQRGIGTRHCLHCHEVLPERAAQ